MKRLFGRRARLGIGALFAALMLSTLVIPPAWPQAVLPYLGGTASFQSGTLEIRAMLTRPRVASRQGDHRGAPRGKREKTRYPAFIHTHDRMTEEVAGRPVPLVRPDPGSYLDQLASDGYVVLFVARRGHWGSQGRTRTYLPKPGETPVNPAELYDDLEAESSDLVAAVDYLHTLSFVDKERIAVSGVGAGGVVALLAAAKDPRIRAVVSLAGGLQLPAQGKDEAKPLFDRAWTEVSKTIQAPVLILWAKNDPIDAAVGKDLEQRLQASGKRGQLVVYPDFKDNGRQMFYQPDGFKIFTPDLIKFLHATIGAPPAKDSAAEDAAPKTPAAK